MEFSSIFIYFLNLFYFCVVLKVCQEISMEKTIFQAGGGVTLCKPYNWLRLMFYQVIPALAIDLGLKFRKEKPR
jgi:hypothetical protein